MTLSEIGALVAGWLIATLNPGVVAYFARAKRKPELLGAIATEVHEVRYKLAIVMDRAYGKVGALDAAKLDLVKPLILDYKGIEADDALAQDFRKLLQLGGDAAYLSVQNRPDGTSRSLRPVPYELPLLRAHVPELTIFAASTQGLLLRIDAELSLYNDQVRTLRDLHERTFDSSLTPENHAIVRSNILETTKKLAERAEIAVKIISQLVAPDGTLLRPAR